MEEAPITKCIKEFTSSLVVQQVRDLALSVQWLELLLWLRFDPWPRNFHIQWVCPPTHTKKGIFKGWEDGWMDGMVLHLVVVKLQDYEIATTHRTIYLKG